MAFTGAGSKIMRSFLLDALTNKEWNLAVAGDTPKVMLVNNAGTPNQDDTIAHNAYNGAGGQWVSATVEVIDVTNWVAGGRALGTQGLQTATAGTVWYDAADTAGGGNVTVSAYGCMVYDDTITTPVADPGMTWHSFSVQPSAVTAGTFTIVWDANGIFRLSL
jgi:hypothetical protein